MVSPIGGYLSVGNAPQVIHRVLIHLFLPEFEAALPFLLNHVTVLCHILGQFMLYIAGKDNTGWRGGVVTHTFTSRS